MNINKLLIDPNDEDLTLFLFEELYRDLRFGSDNMKRKVFEILLKDGDLNV